jgi:hypothetical protein
MAEASQAVKPSWRDLVTLKRGAPPEGELVFVSVDRAGTPGELNSAVLQALKLPTDTIPSADELAHGYAIVQLGRRRVHAICFIVTVDMEAPRFAEALLEPNLVTCLRDAVKLQARSIWVPLMGTGTGGLSNRESLRAIFRAFDQSVATLARATEITIATSRDISDGEFAELEAILADAVSNIADARDEEDRESAVIQYDRPTDDDQLNRKEFAESLATRIDRLVDGDGADDKSLMVQLHAPWGGGKTSFMRMLVQSLPAERWTCVWFNAWENQRIDPPWWTLYQTIFLTLARLPSAPPRRRDDAGRLAPISLDAVMHWAREMGRGLWLRMREYVWRIAVGNGWNIAFIAVGAILALLFFTPKSATDGGINVKDLAAGVGLLITVGGVIRTAFNGLIGGGKAAQGFVEMTQDPIKKLRDHYRGLINRSDRSIIVLIDDLDRCSDKYVVKLLEGIQTMFAHPRVLWVVAADRRWIATAFENEFQLAKTVAEPGNRLGYQFLEKAFQLMITLPTMTDDTKRQYWRHIIGRFSPEDDGAAKAAIANAVSEIANESTEAGILRILEKTRNLSPEAATQLRRTAVKKMASSDVDASVEHFLTAFSPLIKPNPRAMKRLLNGYTFFRDLALLSGLRVSASGGHRQELARWAILCMDAPTLLDTLETQPGLVAALRDGCDGTAGLDASLKPLLHHQRVKWLINGYSDDNLKIPPLEQESIDKFAPLRGE